MNIRKIGVKNSKNANLYHFSNTKKYSILKKKNMNFFKRKTTWTNWELIPLKLAIASIYLLLGAMFWNTINTYAGIISILFGISLTISVYLWIKKMKENK